MLIYIMLIYIMLIYIMQTILVIMLAKDMLEINKCADNKNIC